MVSVSKSTKVLRFATPGRLFASCHFETPAHPQATNATFRWAKRVSTVSTYFPHFEPAISHILSQRFLTFSMYSTVSKLQQMSRFATPMRSAPSQTGESAEHFEMRLQSSAEMPRCVRSLRSPPRPSQQRKPCHIPCDQLRILTRDGQATSDHAYIHKHMSH